MMQIWILIVLLDGTRAVAGFSQEFYTQRACELARVQVEETAKMDNGYWEGHAFCVGKGVVDPGQALDELFGK